MVQCPRQRIEAAEGVYGGSMRKNMRGGRFCIALGWATVLWLVGQTVSAEDESLIFAVVSEVPKDRLRVSAKISINDVVSDVKLLASDTILNNPIWKKLEICHALRIEGIKAAEGVKLSTIRVIDASMLPMSLQTFAGDCLIKKAIEVAPLVD
jgi:hypothetical protein